MLILYHCIKLVLIFNQNPILISKKSIYIIFNNIITIITLCSSLQTLSYPNSKTLISKKKPSKWTWGQACKFLLIQQGYITLKTLNFSLLLLHQHYRMHQAIYPHSLNWTHKCIHYIQTNNELLVSILIINYSAFYFF